jgi:L-seryl-tRNA(Ser) seleniumtransferase
LQEISAGVKRVPGVTTTLHGAEEGLSNRSPRLTIAWDGSQLGITGEEVSKILLDTEPRIVLGSAHGSRPDNMASSISITAYMMMPGDAKVVAERIYGVLSKPPKIANPEPLPQGEPAMVAGQWEVRIDFDRGSATHTVVLEQKGNDLEGTHRGEWVSGDLRGSVAANLIRFRSSQKVQGTRLFYDFSGTVNGDKMAGNVNLGEYGAARWSAQRHKYQLPKGVIRPVKPA